MSGNDCCQQRSPDLATRRDIHVLHELIIAFHCYLRQGYVFCVVCLFACQHDYTKTTILIFIKLGEGPSHGPRQNPLVFGVYLKHGADPLVMFHCR